jgi:hypothetical protein
MKSRERGKRAEMRQANISFKSEHLRYVSRRELQDFPIFYYSFVFESEEEKVYEDAPE